MTVKKGRPLKGSTPLEKRLGFRIPKHLYDELEFLCEKQGINKTDFILKAIEREIHKDMTKENPILERYEQYKKEKNDAYVL